MPFGEASFWVFLTIFGTGLLFLFEPQHKTIPVLGLIVIGFVGMCISVFLHHRPEAKLLSQRVVAWVALLFTWSFLDYMLYLSARVPNWAVWIIGCAVVVLFVLGVSKAPDHAAPVENSIQFFQHRIVLNQARSVISEELQKQGETFWVMWQAGHLMAHIAPEVRKKINRMILCDPNASKERLDYLARTADAGTGDNVRSRIVDATRLALAAGAHVKYRNEQSISIVIANPNNTNKSGWVRIEYILPFMPPTRRPSIVIAENQFPDVFEIFVDAYDEMWADATPAF